MNSLQVYLGLVEYGNGKPALLLQQRGQQVFNINFGVAALQGPRLSFAESLSDSFCQAINIHLYPLSAFSHSELCISFRNASAPLEQTFFL